MENYEVLCEIDINTALALLNNRNSSSTVDILKLSNVLVRFISETNVSLYTASESGKCCTVTVVELLEIFAYISSEKGMRDQKAVESMDRNFPFCHAIGENLHLKWISLSKRYHLQLERFLIVGQKVKLGQSFRFNKEATNAVRKLDFSILYRFISRIQNGKPGI